MVGQSERYARRRTGIDHVTWSQDKELTEVPNDISDVEHHVARRAVLAKCAVHPEAQRKVLRIADALRVDDPRPQAG